LYFRANDDLNLLPGEMEMHLEMKGGGWEIEGSSYGDW
jgi:hypothetical protein